MEKKYQINHIVNHIKCVRDGKTAKKECCLFLGAGADITSGGKLFRELKRALIEMDGKAVAISISDEKLDRMFEESVDKLSQNGRCEALESIMRENKQPSEGYQLMVLLANAGIINNIITTNFDLLLEESEKKLGIEPFRVFAPGLAISDGEYLRRNQSKPVYIKLHGDLNSRIVTHLTREELEKHDYSNSFRNYLHHIIRTNSIIFVGYGGFDPLITDLFIKEIANLDECFWCTPSFPGDDSELASFLLKNEKLLYVETTFDNLFIQLAKSFFANKDLPNVNYIFFASILQSKSDNLISAYLSDFNEHLIIKRKIFFGNIKNFLTNSESKLLLISGDTGLGKTCLLKKSICASQSDIIWLPISSLCSLSITRELSSALGYKKTETPFSLLYSFSSWCSRNKKMVVFVIDESFDEEFDKKLSLEYCNEFITLIKATKIYSCVKYIITFTEGGYQKFHDTFVDDNLDGGLISHFNVSRFNNDELFQMLNLRNISVDHITNELEDILGDPFMWHIMDENNIDPSNIQQDSFFDILIEHISTTIHPYALKHYLKKSAYEQIFHVSVNEIKKDSIYDLLLAAHIIDEEGKIKNNLILRHFCSIYILEECESIDKIITQYILPCSDSRNFSDTDSKVLIFVDLLSNIKNLNDIEILLSEMKKVMEKKPKNEFLQYLTILSVEKIVTNNGIIFRDYLIQVDLTVLSLDIIRCLLKVLTHLRPEWCDIFLNNDNHEISFEAFIALNDLHFKNSNCPYNVPNQFEFLFAIYQLSYWGWDNSTSETYNSLCQNWKNCILNMHSIDENDISYCVDKIKKNAYNIFFNSGTDIDEKYHTVIYDPMIIQLNEKLFFTNDVLSTSDFAEILKCDEVFCNSFFFIVANLLVVSSMRHNFEKTFMNICEAYKKQKFNVEKIDFFLSCLFWALYLCKPHNREIFVDKFKEIVNDYEMIIFEQPSHKREASIKRFREQLEYEFEDGFNPLAFYFYTAPYESIIKKEHDWNKGIFDLSIYWKLANELQVSGNYNNILRIVHALGQMISIYPKEGLMALDNIKPYLSEPIIKRGIVRILKESYIRNYQETENWINSCFEIKNELNDIKYNVMPYINNRTFEQLHWARMFYNIEKMYDIHLEEVFLGNIDKPSFDSFLKSILKLIGTSTGFIREK